MARETVLVSAYHASPNAGSENSKSWQWIRAALAARDVVVVTQKRCVDAIEKELSVVPLPDGQRLSLVYLEGGSAAQALRRLPLANYFYYTYWQLRARPLIRRLAVEHGATIIHHVAFAADWLYCGAERALGARFVWGPVGGASRTPWRLFPHLGLRGSVAALGRDLVTGLLRATIGRATASRSDLAIAYNKDTANALGRVASAMTVRSSVAVDPVSGSLRAPRRGHLVFAGRLLPWKGASIAIKALAYLEESFTLTIYGEGKDRPRLERIARACGVDHRVAFAGRIARRDLLNEFSRAHALVFPSTHDSGGWVVAEAMASGCPVVCLDLGGPPEIVGEVGGVIVSHRSSDVARDIAQAVTRVPAEVPRDQWTGSRLSRDLEAMYVRVGGME